MTPIQKLTEYLPCIFLVGLWLLLGCGSFRRIDPAHTPTPTTIPTATPATAEERVAIYDRHMRWFMSLLLQNVEALEAHRGNAADAFGFGMSVGLNHEGAVEIELPSKADIETTDIFDSDYDPVKMRNYLIGNLAPCAKVGGLALQFETTPLDSLFTANAECKSVLLAMKEQLPRLFECPKEMGLCAD
jgi:hypothetical protein